MWTKEDLALMNKRNINPEQVEKQIEIFKQGVRAVNLVEPATPGNGITCFDEKTALEFVKYYDKQSTNLEILKFVPASGAASRMFKPLMAFYNELKEGKTADELFEKDQSFNSPFQFFSRIKDFAFYNNLDSVLKNNGLSLEQLLEKKDYQTILEYFLFEPGMGYSTLPKALLLFHRYPDHCRTSLEEHLAEGALYARGKQDIARIHFTLSPEHIQKVTDLIQSVLKRYEKKFQVQYQWEYSIQDPSTDTIAVNPDNTPFRNPDGTLLFRPGGHGALIHNLNSLKADLIFIKNIDNVVPDSLKEPTIFYKKLLAGYLLRLRDILFDYQKIIDSCSEERLDEIEKFYRTTLFETFPEDFKMWNSEEKRKYIRNKLYRPVRVCGMVKNEGEPGGGPYRVRLKDGSISLQIIESSQIDMKNSQQVEIMKKSTHFNPVDLVVSTRKADGAYYNLEEFIDPETVFISEKSKDGKPLKALELPGLWNGAMAYWNTAFVEVPLITFNPVKYINDLLRSTHQTS